MHPYTPWKIEKGQPTMTNADPALIGVTIWLLTTAALADLPKGQEVISIFGERKPREEADDDTRGGYTSVSYTAYGLLPDVWHKFYGSAVDKLADVAKDTRVDG